MEALNVYPYCGHSVVMGRNKREWHEVNYVLSFFGSAVERARENYLDFIARGMTKDKNPALTGGGLIRSHGGWTEVKKNHDLLKGDERILGDTSFVMNILSQAQEKIDRRYSLRQADIDIGTIEKRVCEIYDITTEVLRSKRRTKSLAEARSLFCFWAVHELGLTVTAVAEYLDMTQSGAGYAATRGELIAKGTGGYNLFAS